MEQSPLNMAHHYSRKATYHIKANRYKAAIVCHQTAADCLDKAISVSKSTKTIESLKLQRDFHLKYKELIKMKKKHFKKYIRTIDRLRKNKKDEDVARLGQSACQIELSIYRVIDESEVLMDKLIGDSDDIVGCSSSTTSTTSTSTSSSSNSSSGSTSSGNKNNNQISQESLTESTTETSPLSAVNVVVVEELRSLHNKMYLLVRELMSKLDEYIVNSDDLREQIRHLEGYEGNPGEMRLPTEKEIKDIRTEMFSKDNDEEDDEDNAADDDDDDDDEYNIDVDNDDGGCGGDDDNKNHDSDYMKKKYSPEFMAQFHNVVNLMASNTNLHKDDDLELIDSRRRRSSSNTEPELNVNFDKF